MREIDMIALAGLLHDIGKFGQRADGYPLRDGAFKKYDYKYRHGQYTAQILNDLVFNLGDEMSDAAAMHHNPENDTQWIIAAADRIASGFEREKFLEYNEKHDKEDLKKQRLWYLFDKDKRYKIDVLSPENIFPQDENAVTNEYDTLWKSFEDDMKKIKKYGNSSSDFFTIDYLLKKFTTFIPSSTSFKKGEYDAVKANIPLYEHSKATAIFTSALYKLHEQNNHNIINYYKERSGDIEQNDMLLIAGDFFGIQKFIFNAVASAKASKILRAKSAYIQILTKIIAFYIVEELGLSYQSIISTNAGKFEILGVNDKESKEKLKEIQKELDEFFIGKYFGETGIGVSFVECGLSDFIVKGQYKESLRKRVDKAVESAKFKKFDLTGIDPVLQNDEGIDNQNLCQLCDKKKGTEREQNEKKYIACDDCEQFVKIGQQLAKSDYLTISDNSGQIAIFGNYYINFSDKPERFDDAIAIFDISNEEEFKGYAKWELGSYVKTNEKDEILTFGDLAKNSCYELDTGVKALMALKGDVDSMGKYIKDPKNEVTNSFARFNFFARMVDYFFGVKASKMMEGKNLYTVFAGGDDIFILGAWDEVIEFAKELRVEFMKFASGSDLTFSVGMIMTKPNKPINFVADMSEKALEDAKEVDDKNAITLFGETVKWDDYFDDLMRLNGELEKIEEVNMAFLYRLLELIGMSKSVKFNGKVQDTIWKSKLAYSFHRNMDDKSLPLLNTLDEMIEKYPKESKMVLSEFIYKRRDS